LKKLGTVGKMRYTWKNAPHLEKVQQTWENARHLEKGATLVKMRLTWKKLATLRKMPTLGKVQITWKNEAHLKNAAPLEKWGTPALHLIECSALGRITTHLKKCTTFEKLLHT